MKTEKVVQVLSPSGQTYDVGRKLAQNSRFDLHECILEDGRVCLFKIAATKEQNGLLDREAYLLTTMKDEADATQAEYAGKFPKKPPLNYHFLFPRVVETFVSGEYDGRRITVLSFFDTADNLSDLAPLGHITTLERQRIDPRTSAWIMGKLLKLLVFTHGQKITGQSLDGDNILIHHADQNQRHTSAIFDWSEATVVTTGLSPETTTEEIASIAQAVIVALSGDEDDETFAIPPHEEQLKDSRYANFLKNLAEGYEHDAAKAHAEFYALIKELWPQGGFHPYTSTRI